MRVMDSGSNGGRQDRGGLSRRTFLAGAAATATSLLLPDFSWAVPAPSAPPRPLCFYHTHTAEKMVVDYSPGAYGGSVRQALEYFLRDFRTGEEHDLDAGLFNSLYAIQESCGHRATFEVISGYRSPKTNAYLRKNSSGVARKSLHMQGRAIDIRVRGLATRTLRDMALSLHDGGVGYYPKSDFIHIDTGRKRRW